MNSKAMRRDPTHPDSALAALIHDLNAHESIRRHAPRLAWDTYFQVFCTYFYNLGKTGAKAEDRTGEVISLHNVWHDKEER